MPVTVESDVKIWATRFEHQRKIFKNPRGLGYYYALFYKNTTGYDLVLYKSSDGITWAQTPSGTPIKDFGSDIYESASLYYVEDPTNERLIILFVYTDASGNLFYRRGTVADNASDIVLASEIQLLTQDADNKAYRPAVTFQNNRVWIAYRRKAALPLTDLLVDGFSETQTGWSRTGSSPWLDAIDHPLKYIETDVTNDDIGDFSFADTGLTHSVDECYLNIYCIQEAGGNDLLEPSIWDGTSWHVLAQNPVPLTWLWLGWNISTILNTYTKINNAKLRIRKITAGAKDTITVDAAKLVVKWGIANYKMNCRASKIANPTALADFSDEYTLYTGTSLEPLYPIVVNLPSNLGGWNVLIAFMVRLNDIGNNKIRGKEMKWNDASFTEGTENTYDFGRSVSYGGNFGIEEMSFAYVACWYYWMQSVYDVRDKVELLRWTIGSGWSVINSFYESGAGTNYTWSTCNISINRSTSPKIFIAFYAKKQEPQKFYWRTYTLGDPNWSSANEYDEGIYEFYDYSSASLRDSDNKVQFIYTTQTYPKVRFWQLSMIVPPVAVPIASQDGLVCVSG